MAAQENHSEVVKFLLASHASQTLATEVSDYSELDWGKLVGFYVPLDAK